MLYACHAALPWPGRFSFPPSTQAFTKIMEASIPIRALPLCQISAVIRSKVICEGLGCRQLEGLLNCKFYFLNKTEQQKYPLFLPTEYEALQSAFLEIETHSN